MLNYLCILLYYISCYFVKLLFILCLTGSYTDSPGIEIIRRHVAQYIERRDGIPSDYLNILLCAGASDGIKVCICVFIFVLIYDMFFINIFPNSYLNYSDNVYYS